MHQPKPHQEAAVISCVLCDDGDYHNDPDNYDENGVFNPKRED